MESEPTDQRKALEEIKNLILSEPPRRFFTRRALNKSCYEVVHDLDPDGPITESSFKVVATFATHEDACEDAEDRAAEYLAAAILAARSQ